MFQQKGYAASMKTVLFLCTGNYYRSRFAEIYFNHLARQQGLPWRADSRGLAPDARNPGPISVHTLEFLRQLAIEDSTVKRLPAKVTGHDLTIADRVIAVKEAEHRRMIEDEFSEWQQRIEYWHVHDLDCAGPEDALPQLQSAVTELVAKVAVRGAN